MAHREELADVEVHHKVLTGVSAAPALLPAARVVAALAGPGHGALHLLRVLDLSTPGSRAAVPVLPYRAPGEAALEDARTYLYAVAQRFGEGELARLGLRVTWSVLDDADAASGILDEAEGDDAHAGQTSSRDSADSNDKPRYDLIAMATHGRTGLRLWALGSVTDRVLQTTRLPLLIIRPSEAAG